MKALYIHGLDSKPNPTKLKIIESFGCKVLAQHINYRSTPNAFALLDKYIVDNKIEFIIGSSLGGRLGYWPYFWFHGKKEWYNHDYSDEELNEFAKIIKNPPEQGVNEAFIFFNNDYDANAPKNAVKLKEIIEE